MENDLIKQIEDFHNSHTKEEILEIRKSLEKWSNVGIPAKDYIAFIKSKLSCNNCKYFNSKTYHDIMWCRDCQQKNHFSEGG